jgi:hypothetical protein
MSVYTENNHEREMNLSVVAVPDLVRLFRLSACSQKTDSLTHCMWQGIGALTL